MKRNLYLILFSVGVLFLVLMDFKGCVDTNEANKKAQEYINYKFQALKYKKKDGKMAIYNKALEISNGQLRKFNDSLTNELNNLRIKKPKSITIIKEVIKIDTVYSVFHDSLPCAEFSLFGIVDSTNYKIDYTLTNKFLRFNSILIPNTQSVVVGWKKENLFKKNLIVTVNNTNPYVEVTGIKNYTVSPDIKWWQKGWVKFAAGFVSGAILLQQISK